MDKETYKKNKEFRNKIELLEREINTIKNFLNKNESKFKKNDSIKALKNIKEYLIKKQAQLEKDQNNYKEDHEIFSLGCQHEIAITLGCAKDIYRCLICGKKLGHASKEKSIIAIDTMNSSHKTWEIKEKFEQIVYSEDDLIETMTDILEDMQYESKIKVYRR